MIHRPLCFLLSALCSSVVPGHAADMGHNKYHVDEPDSKVKNSNLRKRELQQCNFRCPRNSSRKPNRRCYDSFDDCECDRGFTRTSNGCSGGGNCNFRCPRNSSRKRNRRCYDNFDDCECDRGFTRTSNGCVRNGGDNCNFRCPRNSSRKPNRQCYDNFDDCECDRGFTRTRNGCSSIDEEGPRRCSEDKLVRVYKFCVNGDADGFEFGDPPFSRGPEIEAQIFLDGRVHYPRPSSNCNQDPTGFCKWEEGLCHRMDDSRFQFVEGHRSLTAGILEFDRRSANDNTFASMSARDWYIDTCDPYEVILSRDFKSERQREVCFDLGVSGRVRTPDGRGSIGLSAGVQSCTRWVDPPESYIWYFEVVPRQ